MRRLTWLAAGFGLGAVAAHRMTQGGTQPALVGAASGITTRMRRTLGAAIADGRAEMVQQEVRLRDAFGTDALYEPAAGSSARSSAGIERTKR
jgi:hypothetical protein